VPENFRDFLTAIAEAKDVTLKDYWAILKPEVRAKIMKAAKIYKE